jgi:catechol 2,3-dioxygenase-like lactoylglutathione lyase family enzyme
MSIRGISHVAVGVSDMERGLAFYRDVVGLQVTLDTEERLGGRDGSEHRRRAVYLRAAHGPHEPFIVLDQQLDRPPSGRPPKLFQLGTHHFSFWVDNLEEVVERATADGFGVVVPPTAADAAAYGEAAGSGRILTTILRDGDGNPVQLDQRL